MASRNGLNPKIRGPKGVGSGRALPAPFGFDNGIHPDGVDDYMSVPGLVDVPFPDKATVEFWAYKDVLAHGYCVSIWDNITNYAINATFDGPSRLQRFDTDAGLAINYNWPTIEDGLKTHFVLVIDKSDLGGEGSITLYIDGSKFSTLTSVSSQLPTIINRFELLRYAPYSALNSNLTIDEFRFYKTTLRADQVALNYNFRNGANPSETENLLTWYKFEKFETLDFSGLQDGSDIRLCIRDLSGKNNHAQPFNMDTDPVSPTYALKPF